MAVVRHLFESKIGITFLLLLIAASISGIITLSKSVETQSVLHQKGLTPVFDLVTTELIKPFYVAETVTRASSLKLRMNESKLDEEEVFKTLALLEEEFNLTFFVASEKQRKQYNSNGSSFVLDEEKVEWYFRAKEKPSETFGTLGNREDIHIYFDLKVHSPEGEFLGFIGAGKPLDTFMTSFDNFKRQFGYDFVIVDDNNDVVLSSDKSQLADGVRILNLAQLDWYQALLGNGMVTDSLNNQVIELKAGKFLITEIHLKALNWRMYILNPLHLRQSDSRNTYLNQLFIIAISLFVMALLTKLLINYFQTEYVKKHQKDPLTGLPNRANLVWRFNKMRGKETGISAVIVDIDHFKQINDTFGHLTGDEVLCKVADILQQQVRDKDSVGRWGGEEFVMLLATKNKKVAVDIAQRARSAIADQIKLPNPEASSVTASFGVASKKSVSSLNDIVSLADDALYEAKRSGRNKVVLNSGKQHAPNKNSNQPSGL